jgi:predicted ribosomally synthesized peptide with SipW-like signal peptide
VIVFAVAAIAGGATYALFSDTETSAGNTFTAGTLDLELGGTIQTAPINLPNMKPGDSTGVKTFIMNNVGSIDGTASFSVTYVEHDGTGTTEYATNMLADDVAKMLQIVGPVNYSVNGGAVHDLYDTLLNNFGSNDGDGTDLTLFDLATVPSIPVTDTLTAGGNITISIANIQFDTNAGNDYQNDGIIGYFNGNLVQ